MEFPFGAERLRGESRYDHVSITGATGSGKSVFLGMHAKRALTTPPGLFPRSLFYDPKREYLPILDGLGRLKDCIVLNPMDRRCAAWDLCKDVTNPVAARQLATNLTQGSAPGEQDSRFFQNAVRDIVTAALVVLIQVAKPGSWAFRDLILGVLYPSYLDFLLSQTTGRDGLPIAMVRRVKDVYFTLADYRTKANIRASIQAEMARYEPIAAVWWYVSQVEEFGFPNRFSLSEWIESGDILVLGNDETARATIDLLNQAIFQRAAELMLSLPSQPNTPAMDRTWVFLDEVREAGKLPALRSLLNKGRSHGITVVLTFQDFEGMKAEYGQQVANEIVAQCANKILLKLDSPDSAKWASEAFGSFVTPEQSLSDTTSNQGSSHSESWQRAERRNVETSDFLFLPKAGPENGIHAFYKHGGQDPKCPLLFRVADWKRDINPYLPRPTAVPGFIPHESEEIFYLKTWDQKDWDRLGFESELPSPFLPEGFEPETE